jgi:hypothetical protein
MMRARQILGGPASRCPGHAHVRGSGNGVRERAIRLGYCAASVTRGTVPLATQSPEKARPNRHHSSNLVAVERPRAAAVTMAAVG